MSLSVGVAQSGDSAHQNQAGGYESPSQILSGSATAANTAAAQTILTVPAGRTWSGSITIAATNTASSGTTATAQINTAGTGAIPANAVNLLKVHCSTVGTVVGLASQNNQVGDVTVAAPIGNAVTLTLTNSTATTFTSDASAVGVLI